MTRFQNLQVSFIKRRMEQRRADKPLQRKDKTATPVLTKVHHFDKVDTQNKPHSDAEDETWITMKGTPVKVEEGQTPEEAGKAFAEKKEQERNSKDTVGSRMSKAQKANPTAYVQGKGLDPSKIPSNPVDKSEYIGNALNGLTDLPSNWNGETKVDDPELYQKGYYGMYSTGDHSISVLSDATDGTYIHEHLHARSRGLDGNSYSDRISGACEEGAVQLFTEEICNVSGLAHSGSYSDQTTALRMLNSELRLFSNDYDFAKKLYEIPVAARGNYIKDSFARAVDERRISYDAAHNLRDKLERSNLLNDRSVYIPMSRARAEEAVQRGLMTQSDLEEMNLYD